MPHTSDQWLDEFETKVHSLVRAKADNKHERVRIAIIDSGLDGTHGDFQSKWTRIKGYKSWIDPTDPTSENNSPSGLRPDILRQNCKDSVGHGTHLAALILRLHRWADLYVARVTNSHSPDALLVAQAISYASETWKVDIISLSLGFEKIIPAVKEAIKAVHDRVLIFAAASNRGMSHSNPVYPARDDLVICVHSAKSNGASSEDNPPAEGGKDLMTLGQDVPSAWLVKDSEDTGHQKRCSGSSVATAILAATAGVLLEIIRQESHNPQMKWAASRLKETPAMKLVLGDMSQENGNKRYVELFKYIDGSQDTTSGQYSRRGLLQSRIYSKLSEWYHYSDPNQTLGAGPSKGELMSPNGSEVSKSYACINPDQTLSVDISIDNIIFLYEMVLYMNAHLGNHLELCDSRTTSFDVVFRSFLANTSNAEVIKNILSKPLLKSTKATGKYWDHLTAACFEYYSQVRARAGSLARQISFDDFAHARIMRAMSLNANSWALYFYVYHVALHFPESQLHLPLDKQELHVVARFSNWVDCSCILNGEENEVRRCTNQWNFANGKQGLVRSISGTVNRECKAILWYEHRQRGEYYWKENMEAWRNSPPSPPETTMDEKVRLEHYVGAGGRKHTRRQRIHENWW